MMQKLKCNNCGREYTDEKDISWAKKGAEKWKEMLTKDGLVAKGLVPCPIFDCRGELLLVDVDIVKFDEHGRGIDRFSRVIYYPAGLQEKCLHNKGYYSDDGILSCVICRKVI